MIEVGSDCLEIRLVVGAPASVVNQVGSAKVSALAPFAAVLVIRDAETN